jgi:hypothetical protein
MLKLFKIAFGIQFLSVWAAFVYFFSNDLGDLGIAIVVILGFIVATVTDFLMQWMLRCIAILCPNFIQKPFYLAWKEHLLISNPNADPLYGPQIKTFIENELDKHFEEGGIIAAENALFHKINEIGEELYEQVKQ